jgi:uncharacterized protein YjbJ (UPF0337 family)
MRAGPGGGTVGIDTKPERRLRTSNRPPRNGQPASRAEESRMSATDKIKNAAQDATGKVKEATGKTTDDEQLETEGKADQVSSDFKSAGENVKDAFKH